MEYKKALSQHRVSQLRGSDEGHEEGQALVARKAAEQGLLSISRRSGQSGQPRPAEHVWLEPIDDSRLVSRKLDCYRHTH